MVKRLIARWIAWRTKYCLIHNTFIKQGACERCEDAHEGELHKRRMSRINKAKTLWAASLSDESDD